MDQSFNNLLEQAMKLKANLDGLKQELAGKTLEVTAGNGVIKLVFNGLQEVIAVSLRAEELPPLQQQRLEALLKRAINQGVARSRDLAGQEVANYTGFDPSFFDSLL